MLFKHVRSTPETQTTVLVACLSDDQNSSARSSKPFVRQYKIKYIWIQVIPETMYWTINRNGMTEANTACMYDPWALIIRPVYLQSCCGMWNVSLHMHTHMHTHVRIRTVCQWSGKCRMHPESNSSIL